MAGKTAGVVIMNYIAFMAMLSFLNATLSWLGERVGHPELSFEVRSSYFTFLRCEAFLKIMFNILCLGYLFVLVFSYRTDYRR